MKKEAKNLYHRLQDTDILKREPPVLREQLKESDVEALLRKVLKVYHKTQDNASFTENVCAFQDVYKRQGLNSASKRQFQMITTFLHFHYK